METSSSPRRFAPKSWKLKIVESTLIEEISEKTVDTYQEALFLAARNNGAEHKDVAEAATYLGDLFMHLERYIEAEALYRRSLRIYGTALGEEHMLYSMALRNLAEALKARGETEEAEKLRLQARGIFG